ncbi:MAG: hypothetical protein J5612_04695 [Paludibacteraceae bacterium]|nr:hypothetical protein [Paludibacteraceae bacterium]
MLIKAVYDTATGLDNAGDQKSEVRKVLRDGQLFILIDGKIYNATGARVE